MKRFIILLLLGTMGFVNTALAFRIYNNTDSQIYYRKEQVVINPGDSYPTQLDATRAIITWAQKDNSVIHWDQQHQVICPVIPNRDVKLVGKCGTMTIDAKNNTISCSTGAKAPSCQ